MEFYSSLDQLLNPTVDLGGAPRPDDSKALAQLILGGGRADLPQGNLSGGGVNNDTARELQLGPGNLRMTGGGTMALPVQQGPATPAAAPTPIRSSMKEVLDTADQIATSLSNGDKSGVTKTLLPNPYGPGSYDPNDAQAVSEVKAAGQQAQKVRGAQDLITQLGQSQSPLLANPTAQKEIVANILQGLGITQSPEQEAFAKAKGKAAGEAAAMGGGGGNIEATAKLLAERKLPISALGRLPANQKLALISRATQLDPSLDLKDYETQQKTMNSFSSGRDKDNIVRLNTAVDHLEKLKTAGDALQNSDVRVLNAIKAGIGNATGDPRIKAYKDAAQAVAGEMAAVFKNGTGTDVEIKKWLDQLNASDSPKQIQANFDTLVGLMRGRVDALDSTYERTMHKSLPGGIFTKKAQGIIQKLGSYDLGSNSAEKAQGNAPQGAIDMLKTNPELKDFFKQKYGYLPEGM